MKQILLVALTLILCISALAQRRTTTVRSYYRKDGTFVKSHTRHYNAGSESGSSGSYAGRSSDNNQRGVIVESSLNITHTDCTGKYSKVNSYKIIPTILTRDTSGITIIVAVLRYDSLVADIYPLPKDIFTHDYDFSSPSLYFRIPKDKIKPEHIIELISKYRFDLKDDVLTKSIYTSIGKIDLPPYLNVKFEALILK